MALRIAILKMQIPQNCPEVLIYIGNVVIRISTGIEKVTELAPESFPVCLSLPKPGCRNFQGGVNLPVYLFLNAEYPQEATGIPVVDDGPTADPVSVRFAPSSAGRCANKTVNGEQKINAFFAFS